VSNPKPWVKYDEINKTHGKFSVSPLRRGMGTTVGNSMRRVLLSSLEGAAATSVKITGVDHEFSTLPTVVEDVLDIILNVKGLIFKCHSDDAQLAKISFKGKGKVTGKELKLPSELELVNPSHHIAEVSKDSRFEIEITVRNGVGYVSSEVNKGLDDAPDVNAIHIDSSFSPIVRVNYQVESIRVGKELDYDALNLEVFTNGSVNPETAVRRASEILVSHLELFDSLNEKPEEESISEPSESQQVSQSALELTIDDLELTARSSNCLKRAGVETVQQLVEKEYEELLQIKNFGKKSVEEINDKLKQYSLSLKIPVEEVV